MRPCLFKKINKKNINLQNPKRYSLLSSHFIDQTSVFIHSKIQQERLLLANERIIKKHMVIFILPHQAPDGKHSANEACSFTWFWCVSTKVSISSYKFYTGNKVLPFLYHKSPLNFALLYSASSRNHVNPLPILLL